MARKTRSGGSGPVEENDKVVHLFGGPQGPVLAVGMTDEETEEAKQLMVASLERLIESVRSGETQGIIAIGLRTEGEYGAESYMGGHGVFGQIDRAVGIMEMVKFDLIREARKEDD